MAPHVTLYTYPESPFGQKMALVLLFKRIPYTVCPVARVPPRAPLLALGVSYRRIPVLAIGKDVYLDTSLATIALENVFPEFPLSGGQSWGLQTGASFWWADRGIFRMAASLLDWSKLGKEFLADRTQYFGKTIDPKVLEKTRPNFLSAMRSHMVSSHPGSLIASRPIEPPFSPHHQAVIETQLHSRTSSQHFILDTTRPTYLDLTLFFTLNWVSHFGTADSLFDASHFPLVLQWITLLRAAIAAEKPFSPNGGKPPKIEDAQARKFIYEGAYVRLAKDEGEPVLKSAGLGGNLEIGMKVLVTPDDTGKVGQEGVLVAINAERVVIEVATQEGTCRVHAPRLGFTVASL